MRALKRVRCPDCWQWFHQRPESTRPWLFAPGERCGTCRHQRRLKQRSLQARRYRERLRASEIVRGPYEAVLRSEAAAGRHRADQRRSEGAERGPQTPFRSADEGSGPALQTA